MRIWRNDRAPRRLLFMVVVIGMIPAMRYLVNVRQRLEAAKWSAMANDAYDLCCSHEETPQEEKGAAIREPIVVLDRDVSGNWLRNHEVEVDLHRLVADDPARVETAIFLVHKSAGMRTYNVVDDATSAFIVSGDDYDLNVVSMRSRTVLVRHKLIPVRYPEHLSTRSGRDQSGRQVYRDRPLVPLDETLSYLRALGRAN